MILSSTQLVRSLRLVGPTPTWTRWKHTVRIILLQSLGEHSEGDVIHVSAGQARNHLIPQKMALYAIPQNFERLGRKDPDFETEEERRARLLQATTDQKNDALIAANILEKYLRNKIVNVWRNIDPVTGAVFPGMVDQQALRQNLYRQFKIELESHEQVHILETAVDPHEKISEIDLEKLMNKIETSVPCQVQLRQFGNFVAKITLSGGYTVPLKFIVLKR